MYANRCLDLGFGAVGGLIGTAAIQGLMAASKQVAPQSLPPMTKEPGEFMIRELESVLPKKVRKQIPKPLEKAAATSLGVGYGITIGALYAACPDQSRSTLVDGALLGIAAWAAGYLGWLPALGIMPPITRQKDPQVVGPIIDHMLYGVVTVAAYRGLKRLVSQ